ncbi:MAG TPA: PDZ domain-containing protein [Chitinophagales bacterium]|nr:PDZ domain-containing protein [Chitinophagales bacterium]
MRFINFFILGTLFVLTTAYTPSAKIGGIGGQAIFDSTTQRFKIKSLEINHYLHAHSIRPGDLILEIDKVPIHKMSYSEVLKLVQGTVGTPMSLKVLRYNAIEKYYEINRVRVTLDMNPTWWSVPDYKSYSLTDGINHTISQLKYNAKYALDSIKIPNTNNKFFCNYIVNGAYESTFIKNQQNGKYSWNCGFIKTSDRSKAIGMYNYVVIQLRNYNLSNAKLQKIESIQNDLKTYSISTKEVADINLVNLKLDVKLTKEFDKDENSELWNVELEVKI